MEVTPENPVGDINNKKVICLFDPPHLIKSIRNCLLKGEIKVGNDIILWKILKKNMHKKNILHILKTCFKLTESHINPNSFEKLNVKLATPVFSLNVSTGIELAISLNIFNSKIQIARNTAPFLRKIKDLFDNMNSVTKFSQNPQKNVISSKNAEMLKSLYTGSFHGDGRDILTHFLTNF